MAGGRARGAGGRSHQQGTELREEIHGRGRHLRAHLSALIHVGRGGAAATGTAAPGVGSLVGVKTVRIFLDRIRNRIRLEEFRFVRI